MSFAVYPQPDACRAWMPTTPLPPSMSPPSPPMVCHMPKGHDGQHSNERRPTTLSRRWDGDARPPKPEDVTAPDRVVRLDILHRYIDALLPLVEAECRRYAAEELDLAAVLTVPSQDTPQDIREALFRRAEALRAGESA